MIAQHRYVAHINKPVWDDMVQMKKLFGDSYNKILNEGVRHYFDVRMQQETQLRKRRNSMSSWNV